MSGRGRGRALPGRVFALAALVAIVLAAAAPARAGEPATLRAQVEALARSNDFVLEGSDNIGDGAAMLVSGDPAARLAKLLADHDFVLIRDGSGRIAKLTVLGSRARPAAEDDRSSAIQTSRHGAEHYVEALLEGRGGAPRRLRMLLDTGASTVVLPASMMSTLGFGTADTEEVTLQTAGGLAKGRLGTLGLVRVGRAEASSVAVAFLPDDRLGGKPLLGMSFLSRFIVVIDDAANLVRLESRAK